VNFVDRTKAEERGAIGCRTNLELTRLHSAPCSRWKRPVSSMLEFISNDNGGKSTAMRLFNRREVCHGRVQLAS
jgi:hypothetical protein